MVAPYPTISGKWSPLTQPYQVNGCPYQTISGKWLPFTKPYQVNGRPLPKHIKEIYQTIQYQVNGRPLSNLIREIYQTISGKCLSAINKNKLAIMIN